MSFQLALRKLFKNGRILFRNFRLNQESEFSTFKILPHQQRFAPRADSIPKSSPSAFQSHFDSIRRLILKNVLNRVTNSLNSELRQRTTRQLLFGNSAPFFALIGVSLASGTGIITKEDELEGVCWEIRNAVSRMQQKAEKFENEPENLDEIRVEDFELGPAIAKGSNAVVYAAKKRDQKVGEEAAAATEEVSRTEDPISNFPLAVKMMFNYDAESNATSILRAMYRETVPAKFHITNQELTDWEKRMSELSVFLPPHPNIVQMHCAFADRIPEIPGAKALYPDALPARINPDGYGRNMSLFLLMKRYDTSLKEYLKESRPDVRKGIILLTQLLEAVAHINKHGIAHRDLKSDNILLDREAGESSGCPQLVVTDFGCCLADRSCGLHMPYRSLDADRGGNAALMAPEVALAEPGVFSYIDYSKADAWAAGSIAYEILSEHGNPFYRTQANAKQALKNTTYAEADLPDLDPTEVPPIMARLIQSLLARKTSKRLDAELAATVCQLYLWAPSGWLKPRQASPPPSQSEVLQWLLCLATKVMCEGRVFLSSRRTETEYQLISTFLTRVRLSTVRQALIWIQQA
ncbi:serine/threonine-protein kinase PINK1, mitochondrial [Nilaparvata lugens]|uniref:serine/threonine-protein kinase PINK1, mitochondrial n=1 Tax=Nilaparvata lugens TaxID=108931 RepID=UPI00193D7116|nr:serine/threonine-protein kinase PINK1, mitochondrial [Nilaparvata lugens]